MGEWRLITETQQPPVGQVVWTKIHDGKGPRNVQALKRTQRPGCNSLWWLRDGSMYVYYTPTHWMPMSEGTPQGAETPEKS